MASYLIDTNILSEAAKPQPDAGVMQRLGIDGIELAIAATSLHELRFGIARLPNSERKRRLEAFLVEALSRIAVLPYDARAASWHADERVRLAAQGVTTNFADGQIAATAFVNHHILVTRNERDFSVFEGLTVENWFS